MAKTIDSVLIADATSKLESIGISESFTNLDLLDAIIEVARNIKKNGKAAFKEEEAAKREEAKALPPRTSGGEEGRSHRGKDKFDKAKITNF